MTVVKTESKGYFSDINELKKSLINIYTDVGSAKLSDQEEGSVIYLVDWVKDGQNDHVLSLCKMKTGEYRIYRKLRERLKCFNTKFFTELVSNG